jgi:carbon-monoxide dehydrogenase small subunit
MIRLTVNGKARAYKGPPFKRLIDVLREDLRLTGTKEGCGEGECGACTVLLDGEPVNSCLVPVGQLHGRSVETVEGLAASGALTPLQEAFVSDGGTQCGFCTPGMLLTAAAYIRGGGKADPAAIRDYLAGNLCRCTGYQHIVDSVLKAMKAPSAKRRSRA